MPVLLSPRYWGGHLLMLVCLAVAIGLGIWQYDAWGAHRAAEARDLSNARPVPLTSVMGGDSPFPGRVLGQPVTLRGSWMPDSTLFISDRLLDGRSGYWVMTPVLVDGSGSAMPVVRGWSPRAQATDPTGPVELTGWLQPGEGSGRHDPDPHDDVIPEMRIASIVEHVDADLYSGFVVARDGAGSASAGLAAVTPASIPEVSSLTALRNLLYAIEWWIFGVLAVFIWVRWCRDQLEPPEHAVPASVESAG